jgi:hypothetical protein
MRKTRADANPNASNEKILEQIEKYGPVSAKAIASALKIPENRAMQSVSYMRNKKKINVQKQGARDRREYFYDPEFPIIGAPSLTEQRNEKEELTEGDALFDSLLEGEEQIAPLYPAQTPGRTPKGLDLLVNRCHHLVLALENCSSNTIMDSIN